MKVYVVGMEPFDAGPDGSAGPEAVFSTLEAAQAWGRARGEEFVGSRHWWGKVNGVDETYVVMELELDPDD